jgi:hypothetical protein
MVWAWPMAQKSSGAALGTGDAVTGVLVTQVCQPPVLLTVMVVNG